MGWAKVSNLLGAYRACARQRLLSFGLLITNRDNRGVAWAASTCCYSGTSPFCAAGSLVTWPSIALAEPRARGTAQVPVVHRAGAWVGLQNYCHFKPTASRQDEPLALDAAATRRRCGGAASPRLMVHARPATDRPGSGAIAVRRGRADDSGCPCVAAHRFRRGAAAVAPRRRKRALGGPVGREPAHRRARSGAIAGAGAGHRAARRTLPGARRTTGARDVGSGAGPCERAGSVFRGTGFAAAPARPVALACNWNRPGWMPCRWWRW
jgi:hypothetical protein